MMFDGPIYNSRTTRANVDGNYRVTYHCESEGPLPDTFHLAGAGVTTAEGCARLCRDDSSGCRGAVWGYRQAECWTSNTDEGGKIIPAAGMLYIDPNDHAAGLEQCKSENAQLQAQLDECKKRGGGDGSGEKCPYNDLSSVTENNKTFKVYCKRLDDWGAANIRILNAANAQACIQACSNTEGCTRAIWETKATLKEPITCWLRSWLTVDKVPTNFSAAFSSAHLQ
ncbi:hypothetical protein N7499_000385 [Penicillium canescens]|uniref:Apple domain-containing protein n=1 Tax=Penicillium canescens TaxID=5083 RepID=A0AAD6IGR9_PENCN|nr:uncharacterized protein N7446_011417 [Penicillium canescens]KAJ6029239.1 hypothetical protein N7444_012226 [Penicillium canescens]KAJ6047670.1 hypothetical protein N7460_003817 [Penicillium canescens]KAJ6048734.1 hypothetical protein N7446_011417 [Penicillium canescens]KAJ6100755.1 hypothetical protein N7499_000385 [Penicillium canescens]KAJ6173216.1 hypothetical protein N7485_006028 [Penicillium canescens]